MKKACGSPLLKLLSIVSAYAVRPRKEALSGSENKMKHFLDGFEAGQIYEVIREVLSTFFRARAQMASTDYFVLFGTLC